MKKRNKGNEGQSGQVGQSGLETRSSRKKRRGLSKRATIILSSIVGVLVLAGAYGGYKYYTLQPEQHFANVKPFAGSSAGVPKHAINVLILGSDARPGDVASHSDSILLAHINFDTHEYNILSIPRDSRVDVPGWGYTKLTNVQYLGQANGNVKQGVEDTVREVSALTGVPIHYYAETNYWGLQDMVNSIGTIKMTIPWNETLTHPWYKQNTGKVIPKGTYNFNGEMVAEVIHERDSLPQGDYSRQLLQEEAMVSMAKALIKPQNLPKLPAFFNAVPKYLIASNMTAQDMLSLALAVKGFKRNEIHYYQLKGQGESLYDDVLKANTDQIVLDNNYMKQIIAQHFMK